MLICRPGVRIGHRWVGQIFGQLIPSLIDGCNQPEPWKPELSIGCARSCGTMRRDSTLEGNDCKFLLNPESQSSVENPFCTHESNHVTMWWEAWKLPPRLARAFFFETSELRILWSRRASHLQWIVGPREDLSRAWHYFGCPAQIKRRSRLALWTLISRKPQDVVPFHSAGLRRFSFFLKQQSWGCTPLLGVTLSSFFRRSRRWNERWRLGTWSGSRACHSQVVCGCFWHSSFCHEQTWGPLCWTWRNKRFQHSVGTAVDVWWLAPLSTCFNTRALSVKPLTTHWYLPNNPRQMTVLKNPCVPNGCLGKPAWASLHPSNLRESHHCPFEIQTMSRDPSPKTIVVVTCKGMHIYIPL